MDMPIAFLVFKAIVSFGIPIAVCVQQLIVTKRSIRADRERAAALETAGANGSKAAPTAALPVQPTPVRVRELEPA